MTNEITENQNKRSKVPWVAISVLGTIMGLFYWFASNLCG